MVIKEVSSGSSTETATAIGSVVGVVVSRTPAAELETLMEAVGTIAWTIVPTTMGGGMSPRAARVLSAVNSATALASIRASACRAPTAATVTWAATCTVAETASVDPPAIDADGPATTSATACRSL